MMKIKLFNYLIVIAIIFSVIIPNSTLTINAVNSASEAEIEKKIYSQATLEDDFADNRIMVVMSHNVSMELNDYSISDFSEIKIKNVMDLSSAKREKASAQLEKLNRSFFNRLPVETEKFVSYQDYNQVVCLELEDRGKDKVLEAIEVLQQREDVISVSPDYAIYMSSSDDGVERIIPDDDYYEEYQSEYAELIQLPEAWAISTGASSIKVGVIDTGIDVNHPDLASKVDVSLSRDFTGDAYASSNGMKDPRGHGTHVAGIIGAAGFNEFGICGVCPDVTLVSLRVWDAGGSGHSSWLGMAINYAELNNIPILNFSGSWRSYESNWENFDDGNALYEIISSYYGLLVCTASDSMKNLDDYEVYPANWNLPNLITVGNSTIDDEKTVTANFSKTKVDLFAPGECVISCYPVQNCIDHIHINSGVEVSIGYHEIGGSSQAAPMVTGVAALMLANNPDLEPREIKCIIMRNVDTSAALQNYCVSGGRLNAYKALTGTLDHDWSIAESESGHVVECYYCKYTCHTPTFTNLGEIMGVHRVSCTECGINYTEPHSWERYQTYFRCEYCNCTTTNNPGILSWRDQELTE